MNKIRLFLIVDNRLLREGLSAMLKKEPDIKIAAAIDDCNFDIKTLGELKPDIALIDFGLVKYDSLDLVKTIKSKYPELKIIVMDLIPIHEDIVKFIEAGVSGFLGKEATLDEFTKTIRSVLKGEKVLPAKLTESLFSQIVDISEAEFNPAKIAKTVKMTKRENEIIELISSGMANKEIANKLKISLYTVKSHVHNILEKMSLSTRVQIAINSNKTDDPPLPKK